MGLEDRRNPVTIGTVRSGRTREFRVIVADFEERPFCYLDHVDDSRPDWPRAALTIRPQLLGELAALLQRAAAECARRNGGRL